MTLLKLSLRNARRQARDYMVYFATMVLAAALLYAFNGLVFSPEIRRLSDMLDSLPFTIVLASAVVVCIFGWLVSYSTQFMLTRRSREFGTYLLIGLESRQVVQLFLMENLVVGTAALGLGLVLGNLLFQALWAIVLALFRKPYYFSFSFSLSAAGLTLLYFILIYVFAQFKSRRRIRRMKIYDLIYLEKQNEGVVIQTRKKRQRVFTVSIVLGVVGTCLLMTRDMLLGIIGAGVTIISLFGFFLSFASGVPAFFDRRPALKYRGQNLLVFRTLTAKLATMGTVMAIISVIFTATIISEGSGMVFRGLIEGRAAHYSCFDLCISITDDRQDHTPYLNYIDSHIPVESGLQYVVYQGDGDSVTRFLEESAAQTRYLRYYDTDLILRYSDYAALRAMLGYPEVSLEPGTCLIHCMEYLERVLTKYDAPVTVGGTALIPGGIHTEPLNQYSWDTNGGNFVLVVPDELAEEQPAAHRVYCALTALPVTVEQFESLRSIRNDSTRPEYDTLHGAADEQAEAAAQIAVLAFPLFFLALALTMTAAAILTIQQLGETDRYRRQFALLRKLGMDRREMAAALRKQFAVYYAMPALPALLIGESFIFHLATLPEAGLMSGSSSPGVIAGVSLVLFFLIYAVYILLAYIATSDLLRSDS